MPHDIRPISAAAARPLRQLVLRPQQAIAELVFPGDDHPLALHAGAFAAGELVGIASVMPEACPAAPDLAGWRLRGMASLPALQRQGYGAALIAACVAHIWRQGGDLIWCHGRSSALAFYAAQGFVAHGDQFDSPITGPHYLLWRRLTELSSTNT